jgi:hypothetical protein
MVEALKLLLQGFENMSGLRINYTKSELIPLNISQQEGTTLANILGCKVGKLPITYLGTPLHWKKLNKNDWNFLINKIEKKITLWKEKLLSLGGRLTLIKSVLNTIPIYWMSNYRLPVHVRKRIEQLCRKFLWFGGSSVRKKGYNLVSWKTICANTD